MEVFGGNACQPAKSYYSKCMVSFRFTENLTSTLLAEVVGLYCLIGVCYFSMRSYRANEGNHQNCSVLCCVCV